MAHGKAGAPTGNSNAKKAKLWEQAIKRALARKADSNIDGGLDLVADEFVNAAVNGDQWAIKELGDRIDGKPAQIIEGTGDNGEIIVKLLQSDAEIL